MNIKTKFTRFYISYLGSFGAAALIFSVSGYFNETFYRFLLPSAVALVLPAAINALVLCRRPQTSPELWLGRAFYGLSLVLCTLLSYSAFGLYKSWKIVLLAGAVMVGLYALWGVPLFILADRREKRSLQDMNAKFMSNTEEP